MRILALIAICFTLACEAADAPIVTEISREEFAKQPSGTSLILDVRTSAEYAAGHIENALNIPHDQLPERLPQIQEYAGVPVVVYCKSGGRAAQAVEVLAAAGFTNVRHLAGDMDGWGAAGLPVETDGP
jgi:rhodanese-related sulfurtransferase